VEQGVEIIEKMAGKEHYLYFKQYQSLGGLNYFLDYHQLIIKKELIRGLGVIRVIKASPINHQ
jgi:hypothetical protein